MTRYLQSSFGRITLGIFLAVFLPASMQAGASPYALIIGGSGGDKEYQARFAGQGEHLKRLLSESLGYASERVRCLLESGDPESSTREAIHRAILDCSRAITPDDDLFIILIGHGSYLNQTSRFHIPGPDLTAGDLNTWLSDLTTRRMVIIDTTSSSAGFINVLSGPGRIILTATRSTEERNATVFMDNLLTALAEGSADLDRDGRISVLEAGQQAAALTDTWYLSQGLLPTEHALLDDNGDGVGTRFPILLDTTTSHGEASTKKTDGDTAKTCWLKSYTFPKQAPPELVKRYVSTLEAIEQLKQAKSTLDEKDYYKQLEALLLTAARTNRDIRRYAD